MNALLSYLLLIFIYVALYSTLALSLNLVVGFSGMLSLGHAGFLSLGAYVVAVFTVHLATWNFWLILLAAGLFAALLAALLGSAILRLKGDYLAIASLGFAEIIRSVFISTGWLTRGARGISNIVGPNILGTPLGYNRIALFLLSWVLVLCCYLGIRALLRSRIGRAIEAVREDDLAASASGINPALYRSIAFSVAAFFAALAGGIWAVNLKAITPSSVGNFNLSVLILAMVVFGGMANQKGVLLAVLLLVLLENASLLVDFIPPEVNQMIYGLLLVLMMLYRPQGLLPSSRRLWKKKNQ